MGIFLGGRPGTRLTLLLVAFVFGAGALLPDVADVAERVCGLLAICILLKGNIQLFFQKY